MFKVASYGKVAMDKSTIVGWDQNLRGGWQQPSPLSLRKNNTLIIDDTTYVEVDRFGSWTAKQIEID